MKVIEESKKGVRYITTNLKDGLKVYSKAFLWKIPHNSGKSDICLKLGRYSKLDKSTGFGDIPEVATPKSELTLADEEFKNLISFISQNYQPLFDGVNKYIPLDNIDKNFIEQIKIVFDNRDKQKVLEFILKHNLLPSDIVNNLQIQKRIKSVMELEKRLNENSSEYNWQEWFKENNWILGSDFIRILEERDIDTKNIADYLMEAYDGFLDIIEIKKPSSDIKFWNTNKDHNNIIPHSDLVKAIVQSTNYIYEIEREMNSDKFLQRIGRVPVVKPRGILIFGRSDNWSEDEKKAYRLLNSSYHNLTILTFDHILLRAKRILGIN